MHIKAEHYIDYISGYTPLYYLTLNSHVFDNDRNKEVRQTSLGRKVKVLIDFLRDRVVSPARKSDIRAVAFYEIGKSNYVSHAHIVLAAKGGINKNIDWLRAFIHKKWSKLTLVDGEFGPKGEYWNKKYSKSLKDTESLSESQRRLNRVLKHYYKAMSDPMLPWEVEVDSSTKVLSIDGLEGCSRYSAKDFIGNMMKDQYCSIMLY